MGAYDLFNKVKASNHCLYHLLPPQRPLHDALRVRGHQFQLPNWLYKCHKQSFIASSLFTFLNYFFGLDFSLLCIAIHLDFILCTDIYCYVLQLVMFLRIRACVLLLLVVVTFFNHHFVNCKATLILEIKNLRNKIQYKPKWCTYMAIMK